MVSLASNKIPPYNFRIHYVVPLDVCVACMHVKAKNWCFVSFSITLHFFLVSQQTQSSSIWLGCLASELQGSSCLCLHSAVLLDVHHGAWLFLCDGNWPLSRALSCHFCKEKPAGILMVNPLNMKSNCGLVIVQQEGVSCSTVPDLHGHLHSWANSHIVIHT